MCKISPIVDAYQILVSKGRLKTNPSQADLVHRLGQLQETVLQHKTRTTTRLSTKTVVTPWTRHQEDQQQHQNGMYIYGGVGTGKSRIADLFAATLPSHIACRRAHFFEFMVDTHSRLHRSRSDLINYKGDPLIQIGREIRQESPVLCLDEFQVSDIADAMILKRLFGSFWSDGGIMVSTSNRHPTELYKNGLNRSLFVPFIEELQRRCVVFEMLGDRDYRMDGKQRLRQRRRKPSSSTDVDDVFFTDLGAFQEALMDALQGASLETVELPVVMGRKLSVKAARPLLKDDKGIETGSTSSKLIVSATFANLCEASLGASDYHALCSKANTVFISGLRKFQADELDIVRRFITLVDIAYESRTRVVCLSTDSMLQTFANIVAPEAVSLGADLTVKGEGGSSSSMMSTFIGNMEWSATGLKKASLATGGAGETDVRFAVKRALSRLYEMNSESELFGDHTSTDD